MKEKIDCKIVEDLLIAYLDGTLNPETKEIVYKHFSECESCKSKFEDLKNSMIEDKASDKKCVEYLKKAKRKERINTIKWILLIIVVILLIIWLRKSIIITKIYNKRNEYLSSNNIYIQKIEHQPNSSAIVTEYYYKDGKYKKVTDTYANDKSVANDVSYGTMNMEDFKNIISDYTISYDSNICTRIYQSLGVSIFTSIKSSNLNRNSKEGIKKCYVITDNNNNKTWYDKETGLMLKQVVPNSQPVYYSNTYILKQTQDQATELIYEFNCVTDDDIEESNM